VNGVHDMGGMQGYGPILPRENDETFHAEWEKRVHGFSGVGSMRGIYNIDEYRHAIERMRPAVYLSSSYYERWLASLETLLVEKNALSRDEIEARTELLRRDAGAARRRDDPSVAEAVIRGRLRSTLLPAPDANQARFKDGDLVIARNVHPTGHTRLPRYARGKRGVVQCFHGVEPLPDANAHGRGPSPEPLYNVRFEASELWGASADGRGWVHIDLWESYLEPAAEEGDTA
jgi:nitrile hydratase